MNIDYSKSRIYEAKELIEKTYAKANRNGLPALTRQDYKISDFKDKRVLEWAFDLHEFHKIAPPVSAEAFFTSWKKHDDTINDLRRYYRLARVA